MKVCSNYLQHYLSHVLFSFLFIYKWRQNWNRNQKLDRIYLTKKGILTAREANNTLTLELSNVMYCKLTLLYGTGTWTMKKQKVILKYRRCGCTEEWVIFYWNKNKYKAGNEMGAAEKKLKMRKVKYFSHMGDLHFLFTSILIYLLSNSHIVLIVCLCYCSQTIKRE